ncbi:MAG TPA: thiamine pyrophosphate-dependent enzyme [Chloroflexota bacterium]|nr:thiamine pyrophosphate-dependent enzyme [Chloroflexota bacterium]
MSTVAEQIARTLADAGVRYVFGHPGGEVAHLIEALRQVDIPFVLTRHEATAGFLAASWGELSGRPGVCLSTLGPGATNLLSGVAQGYLDRCPMIAITAQLATDREIRSPHQRLDLGKLFAPVTKASIRVAADTAATAVEHALYLATSERPGPVHLEVPSNVAAQPFEGVVRGVRFGDVGRLASPGVDQARDALAGARRPAILAGIGAVRCQASDQLVRLAETLGAPVVTTPKAKGVFPEDHPLAAGVMDMTGEAVVNELLREADLLLTAGFDVVELIKPWGFAAPVVHLDTIANTDQLYEAQVEVVGNVALALAELAETARPSQWPSGRMSEHKRRLRAALRSRVTGLAPQTVMETVRELLPRHGVVASDVGAHKILLGQVWTAYEPRTYVVSNGLSSMGTGIPGAMAARLLWPERPAVAIVGDGGLGMYLGELETAVRLGIDLPIVVLVDGSLSLIKLGQVGRGYPPAGVDFDTPQLSRIAEGFGAAGERVTTAAEVRGALERALERGGVTLIEAVIDARAYTGGE